MTADLPRPLPFESLVAYYQAADIAWITPLADGMNLVAKEFCAARVDGDERAGAVRVCRGRGCSSIPRS